MLLEEDGYSLHLMLNKFIYHIALGFFGLLILLSGACKKTGTHEESVDLGYAYFPVDSGIQKIYRIDSVAFDDNAGTIDTFHFLLKEEFSGFIFGQFAEPHMVINRFTSAYNDTIWKINTNWKPAGEVFVLRTNQNLQWVQDNKRVVKLVFPVGIIGTWNGNMFNETGRKNFQITSTTQSTLVADSIRLNECAVVLEGKITNNFEEQFIQSVYARNIGLVNFTNQQVFKQNGVPGGFAVYQKLIRY